MSYPTARRILAAQIAANTRWSREDPHDNAVRGQAGLAAKFERLVDPQRTLDPVERARRAECARRAHMQRLALASSKARARRKAARKPATGAGDSG